MYGISVKERGTTQYVYVKSENIDVACMFSKVHIDVVDEATKLYHIIIFKDGDGSVGIFTKGLPLFIDENLDVKKNDDCPVCMEITRRVKQ